MGNLYKNPEQPLTPAAFRLARVESVGTYGLQPVWADGHATGIYSFDYLRRAAGAGDKAYDKNARAPRTAAAHS